MHRNVLLVAGNSAAAARSRASRTALMLALRCSEAHAPIGSRRPSIRTGFGCEVSKRAFHASFVFMCCHTPAATSDASKTAQSAIHGNSQRVRGMASRYSGRSRSMHPPKASCTHCNRGVGAGPLRSTPHPRARGFGPVFVSAAMVGSASGPAIALDNLRCRRAIKAATSTTVESLAVQWFRCVDAAGFPRS